MNVVKHIKRNKKYNEEIISINREYKKNVADVTKKYIEEPCIHNIVVKFYGTLCSYSNNKPLYICLGCHEDFTQKAEEIENDSTKKIIDLTGVFWYFVSKKSEKFNQYAVVNYLRELAILESTNIPDYSDEDFVCSVNSCIKQNNTFK